MSREWDDARLREAFQAFSDVGDDEVDTVRVWQAVTGELSAEERRDIVDKVASDAGYAEAWRIATELARAQGETVGGAKSTVAAAVPEKRAWRYPVWAAAAALVAGVVGFYLLGMQAPSAPIYRGAVDSLVASDTRLPRDEFRLEWSGPPGSRFDVRVTTGELQLVEQVSGLDESSYVVPADRFDGVSSGTTIFWQVEATLTDGSVVESETFIVQLE